MDSESQKDFDSRSAGLGDEDKYEILDSFEPTLLNGSSSEAALAL